MSVLYDIAATIRYDYAQPTAVGRTLLRLMPADLPGRQRLVTGRLTIAPAPAERLDRTDFFGNAVTEVEGGRADVQTLFSVAARVECVGAGDPLDLSPPLPGLAAAMAAAPGLAPGAPHHFLTRSDRTGPAPAFTDFARAVLPPDPTAFRAAVAVGAALHDAMRFDPAATTVETDPAEAFAARHGVCQDFSHILIGCLRGIGLPAAYVSGYLRTTPPPGQDRLAGADAMHAWVAAWCGPEMGWIEYDPTNACLAGTDHIRVAMGRDYDDVAPVKGVLRTSGPQLSRQAVDVIPLEGPFSE